MRKAIKEEQWIMLSTEDETLIYKTMGNGLLHFIDLKEERILVKNNKNLKYQHLYLISDEIPKNGDICYNPKLPTKKIYVFGEGVPDKCSKKIIATTDKSLVRIIGDRVVDASVNAKEPIGEHIPQIPESFVKYFVEKQGKVGDVEIEYEFVKDESILPKELRGGRIVTNVENEIVIHLPEDWTKVTLEHTGKEPFACVSTAYKEKETTNKEFAPHEESLALRKLGFDEKCLGFYREDDKEVILDSVSAVSQQSCKPLLECLAPLYQQAFRWFRKEHSLYSYIKQITTGHSVYIDDNDFPGHHVVTDYMVKKTFEEAELACLRKLIEIVKTKKEK